MLRVPGMRGSGDSAADNSFEELPCEGRTGVWGQGCRNTDAANNCVLFVSKWKGKSEGKGDGV